ncbi:MAG TPA: universal stress protein [Bryobacteraceae bacterium]|nr:universal stress protein [Bryobacteraceae bacterium]
MTQIKRVLFPIDFSPACSGAARYVEALAGRFEAEIMLLHVVGPGEHALAEELMPHRRQQLDAFAAGDLRYFSTCIECVTGGDPAAAIQNTAKRWGADFIMIPSHGLGIFRRLMLGSVAAKVLHDAECPVWTSVHAEEAPELENIHCRKVLCAVDLGPGSRAVLSWAAWFANEQGAALGIVHAVAPWPSAYYGGFPEDAMSQTFTTQAGSKIAELKHDTNVEGEVFTAAGEICQTVAGAAAEFGADVLVTGRHSGNGASQYLGPHAYSIIRRSPCPVISI